MSTLQALEPRALIPGTQRKPQHTDVKPAGGSGQLAAAPTPQNIHLKYKFLVLSCFFNLKTDLPKNKLFHRFSYNVVKTPSCTDL